MYHLRRWNHPSQTHHNPPTTASSSTSTTSSSTHILLPPQPQELRHPPRSTTTSQIPMQLEVAMKQMNSIQKEDYYYQDNLHTQPTTKNDTRFDEITMEDCTACRHPNRHSLMSDSTIQHYYYSITSLFRNHKKVVARDGLTKRTRWVRPNDDDDDERPKEEEEVPVVEVSSFHPSQSHDDTFDNIEAHCNTSSTDVPMQRQLVNNDCDRTNLTNSHKNHKTKMIYHIDTSIVQDVQSSNKTLNDKKKPQEEEEEDQLTALETPSPVHTDDETDDDMTPTHTQEEPKHLKFFRRGKLV